MDFADFGFKKGDKVEFRFQTFVYAGTIDDFRENWVKLVDAAENPRANIMGVQVPKFKEMWVNINQVVGIHRQDKSEKASK